MSPVPAQMWEGRAPVAGCNALRYVRSAPRTRDRTLRYLPYCGVPRAAATVRYGPQGLFTQTATGAWRGFLFARAADLCLFKKQFSM